MAEGRNILAVIGEDDFLVNRAAREFIAAHLPPEAADSALETVNGRVGGVDAALASVREAEESLRTPPFLDPVKLTWWRAVTFLPGGEVAGEALRRRLDAFVQELARNPPPENQFFLITADRLLKTTTFAKALAKVADLAVYAVEKSSRSRKGAAFQRVEELAAAEGLSMPSNVAWAFVEKAGSDTRTLASELAKLRTYLGDGRREVTLKDLAAVTSPGGDEPDFWELTDAVSGRNAVQAARLVDSLSDADPNGIMFATVLERHFRELIVYRDALDRKWVTPAGWSRSLGEREKALLAEAGAGPAVESRSWIVGKKAEAAARFTAAELRIARWRMLKVRERLVSGAADGAVALVKCELLRSIAKGKR